jgi:transposase
MAAVNDPTRFGRSRGLGAYFGLTPRRHVGNRCAHTNSHQKLRSPSTH